MRFSSKRLVDDGAAARPGQSDEAAGTPRDALALWRGPALADFGYDTFAQFAITKLEELRLTAPRAEDRSRPPARPDRRPGRGARVAVAEHPLRQQFRAPSSCSRSTARGAPRRRDRALPRCPAACSVDGSLEPSPELRELAGRMLREDPSLTLPEAATHIRNPYKGLHAFVEGDAGDFFGREELTGARRAAPGRALRRRRRPERSGKSPCSPARTSPAARGAARIERLEHRGGDRGCVPARELEAALLGAPGRLGAPPRRRPTRGGLHADRGRAEARPVPRRRRPSSARPERPGAGGHDPARRLLRPAARLPGVWRSPARPGRKRPPASGRAQHAIARPRRGVGIGLEEGLLARSSPTSAARRALPPSRTR